MRAFNKHVVIVGTARSGTSWLSEIIATQYRYRILFEPEHEFRTQKGKLICDRWFNKLPSRYSQENRYLSQVFSNQVDCNWIGQLSNRKFKRHLWPFIPKKYIIKFVRANLAAQYINDTYEIPVIHIIRNPFEVIKSQLRINFPWLYDLSIFLSQRELVELIRKNYGFDVYDYKSFSKHEILALRWCIENVIPLELKGGYKKKSMVVRYEDLNENLDHFISLCEYFNLNPRKDIEEVYHRPSSKTHPFSRFNQDGLDTKKTILEIDEINRISNILDSFNTKLYSVKPNV